LFGAGCSVSPVLNPCLLQLLAGGKIVIDINAHHERNALCFSGAGRRQSQKRCKGNKCRSVHAYR
jgi:hypothetical protein